MSLLLMFLYVYTLMIVCTLLYLLEENVCEYRFKWAATLFPCTMRYVFWVAMDDFRGGGNARSAFNLWWHLMRHTPNILHAAVIIVRVYHDEGIDPAPDMILGEVFKTIDIDKLIRGFRVQSGVW